MKKLTFLILSLLLVAYADKAEAQRKKWERAGRPANSLIGIYLSRHARADQFTEGGRVLAILFPAGQLGAGQSMAPYTTPAQMDDPALIVFDVKNPNLRRIFPLTDPVFADGTVRLIGFANVADDADGNDYKEAILKLGGQESFFRIAVVSHKTGLVMAFQDHDFIGLRNYDSSEDGFLDMLLYNRAKGKMEVWGN